MPKKGPTDDLSMDMQELEMKLGRITFCIVGTSPMLMHRFAFKQQREILFPSPKKNRAERESSLKHNPEQEFRDACYLNRDPNSPALFHIPQMSFSAALANAALDVPGATKSKLMRLAKVSSPQIDLFGIPRLHMAMTRSSDIAKTPDIRTRPIFPRWACKVEVDYVSSLLKQGQIAALMATAGVIIGIGDWRSQKGGMYGGFRLAAENDPEYLDILKTEGREAQLKAFKHPVCHDAESEELLTWFKEEAKRREKDVSVDFSGLPQIVAATAKHKRNGKGARS